MILKSCYKADCVIETQKGMSRSTKRENTKSVGSFTGYYDKNRTRNQVNYICPNKLSSFRKYVYPINFFVSSLIGYKIIIWGEVEVNTSGKINV